MASALQRLATALARTRGDIELQSAADLFEGHDIADAGLVFSDDLIRVTAAENTHFNFKPGTAAAKERSYACRFDTPSRCVVFSGDTGPSEALAELAKNADVLIGEVIDLEATETWMSEVLQVPADLAGPAAFHMAEEHLVPEELGKLAAKAGVKAVLLTHVVPGLDGETDMGRYAAGVGKHFGGSVAIGQDLLEFRPAAPRLTRLQQKTPSL